MSEFGSSFFPPLVFSIGLSGLPGEVSLLPLGGSFGFAGGAGFGAGFAFGVAGGVTLSTTLAASEALSAALTPSLTTSAASTASSTYFTPLAAVAPYPAIGIADANDRPALT